MEITHRKIDVSRFKLISMREKQFFSLAFDHDSLPLLENDTLSVI
jgi:hypothetical protein